MNEKLTAHVKAVNEANAYANELHPKVAALLAPMIGERILTDTGSLLPRARKLFPKIQRISPTMSVVRYVSSYDLSFTVKVGVDVFEDGSTFARHGAEVYVANIDKGVLKRIIPCSQYRTDYTVEEVSKAQTEYEKARDHLAKLRYHLRPFDDI